MEYLIFNFNLMRKIFYILLCIMFVSSCKEHQLSNYGIEFQDKNCKICLDKNNNYTISVESLESSDMIFVMLLSQGKYERHKNNLLLCDDEGFEMSFKIKKNKLSPNKSFAFMRGYDQVTRYIHKDDACFYNYDSAYIKRKIKKINEFKNTSSSKNGFYCGMYESVGYVDGSININENGTFEIAYKDLLLSKGEWKIEDNMLYLYDLDLSYQHEIIINGKTLMFKKSFGDFDSVVFKLYKLNLKQ